MRALTLLVAVALVTPLAAQNRYASTGGTLRVALAQQPLGPNGPSKGPETMATGGIQQIQEQVIKNKFSTGSGRMIRENVVADYTDEVMSDIAIAIPLKIVIDAGNGVLIKAKAEDELYEQLNKVMDRISE